MTEEMVFIGIDPTAGVRPITYAVLDERLRIKALRTAPLEEVLADVLSYPLAVCGIDAPAGRNKGLLADREVRARMGLPPDRDTYNRYRLCEYELRRRGIHVYSTPPDEQRVPRWMRVGWELYDRLRAAGFVDFPLQGARRVFETYPHAAYTVLINKRPYAKTSVEGLLQRQLVLYDEGVDVPDPMRALEEWTRHRLRTGQLDLRAIHSHDELDALMAAYTAYMVEREPHHTTALGDPSEGVIVLPTANLQDAY